MPTLSGLLGNSFIGLQGNQGLQGLQGTQGVQGLQGSQGAQSLQGSQGAQGLQGTQGAIIPGVPQNSKTSSYTLIATDVGKHISTNSNVIVPVTVFSSGDTVTIYNNSALDILISKQSGQEANITLYLAGTSTNTTNRTLAQRGLCTLLCIIGGSTPTFVIAGSGLT